MGQHNDFQELLRQRALEQARAHWSEFSVIIASANILGALLLCGSVLTLSMPTSIRVLASMIAVSSMMASLLAYYGIQIGAMLVMGPLRIAHLISSFVLAGAQLSMFLWPLHVLRREDLHTTAQYLNFLGLWLVFLAVFALSAAMANYEATLSRRRRGLAGKPELATYEKGQRRDRFGALATAIVTTLAWLVSYRGLQYFLILSAVAVGAVGMGVALVTQARVVRSLLGVEQIP